MADWALGYFRNLGSLLGFFLGPLINPFILDFYMDLWASSPLKYGPAKIERKRVKNQFLLIICII